MKNQGFTLSELLIALVILGLIATFTIPKVLQSQQANKYNAMAKEVASMVTGAYDSYKLDNGGATANTGTMHLTPYFNYVRLATSGLTDAAFGQGSYTCSSTNPCLHLHNGGSLWIENMTFDNTASTNALWFLFDPVSGYSGITNGPDKGVYFAIYFNSKLRTWGTIEPNTTCSNYIDNPNPARDPSWFSWN